MCRVARMCRHHSAAFRYHTGGRAPTASARCTSYLATNRSQQVYNLTTVMIWNRFPWSTTTTVGAAIGAKLAGARMQFLNYNGDAIANYTLNGNMVQVRV